MYRKAPWRVHNKVCYVMLCYVINFVLFLDAIYEPVGCFKDTTGNPRPLPILVKNYRWPSAIDWNNLNNTIRACAEKVKEAGFVYFGLQFYGECWSGPQAHLTYDEDGKSKHCVLGVGKNRANFVYRLVFEGKVYKFQKTHFCIG